MIDVSVVIVCMNNLDNLYPCLDSFKKYTSITYECLVVAFMFSPENILRLRNDYPWVKIIESNEYRGFSENNNLALRQAEGRCCLVVNDDTYHEMPLVDMLYHDLSLLPNNVAVISPSFWNADGSLQSNGRPPYKWYTYFFKHIFLAKPLQYCRDHFSRYTNKEGLYKTYNLSGACFMIKTDLFKKVGWFDERFYFCPEDLALSTLLNKMGYECWVDADVKITHLGGKSSSSIMQVAIAPTKEKGEYIWLCGNNYIKKALFIGTAYVLYPIWMLYCYLRYKCNGSENYRVFYQIYKNMLFSLSTKMTPKEIFIHYYEQIRHK